MASIEMICGDLTQLDAAP